MKKLAIIAMSLVLIVCLAACGPRDTTDTTTTPTTVPSTTAATNPTTQATVPATTTAPTNENGAVGDMIDGMTGNNATTDTTGRSRSNAANMR